MDEVFFPHVTFWSRLFGASFGRLDGPFLWDWSQGSRGTKNDLIPLFGWLATLVRCANRLGEYVDFCVVAAEKKEAIDISPCGAGPCEYKSLAH
jgi:hypothetical protein